MRILKVLGLAAIAATALMAVGVAGATATEFYSGTTTLGAGTEIKASLEGSTSVSDTSANPIDTCLSSELKSTLTSAGSSTTTVSSTVSKSTVSFSSCSSARTVIEGGELEPHHIGGTKNATMTAKGFDWVIHVFGVECGYTMGSQTDLGTLTGSTTGNATLDINAIISKKTGGFLCPSTTRLIANYTITSPTPLHVTAS